MIARLTSPGYLRAYLLGAVLAGALFNAWLLVTFGPSLIWWVDIHSYWQLDLRTLYDTAATGLQVSIAFRYAPAIAWLFMPLSWVPFEWAVAIFTAANLGAVAILGRRWAPVLLLAFPPVLLELVNGNIHLLLALAIWAGLRWPAAWAFVLLTKVTPGVGLVWFAARREWRSLAIALGATAAIVIVGFAIAPDLWLAWFNLLAVSPSMEIPSILPPLVVRIPLAILLTWYAARTDRAWLVPAACALALPTVWLQGTALLTASFPLWWDRARFRRTAGATAAATTTSALAPTRLTGDAA